jgi:phosphomevalonate kinase
MTRQAYCAPGKLVLSGAYSVLWGAPAIVAAVDRYAIAFPDQAATYVSEEVQAAIDLRIIDRACHIDASALRAPDGRGGTRKLGLGSSAAIVVATLAALEVGADVARLQGTFPIFEAALRAHRHVQPGGSGLDVVASTFGGVLRVETRPSLSWASHPFPSKVLAYASRSPASTKEMVARVRELETRDPDGFSAVMARARQAAIAAAHATTEGDLLVALWEQDAALRDLGKAANVPIFTAEFDALAAAAKKEGAFFGPSGAGGGDMGIRIGSSPPGQAFATALEQVAVDPIDLSIDAEGLSPVDPSALHIKSG